MNALELALDMAKTTNVTCRSFTRPKARLVATEFIRVSADLVTANERLRIAREAIIACAPEDGISIEHKNGPDTCAWCGSSSRWDSASKQYVDHHSDDCAWVLARKTLAALDAPSDPQPKGAPGPTGINGGDSGCQPPQGDGYTEVPRRAPVAPPPGMIIAVEGVDFVQSDYTFGDPASQEKK